MPAPNARTLKHLAAPWTLGTEHGPDEVGAVLEAAGSFEG